MALLTIAQLMSYAQNAGFRGQNLAIIVAIAQAESGGNTNATHTDVTGVDRGVLQLNSVYHSEVKDSCAFDPACSFKEAFRISQNGQNFVPWATFNSGAYQQYMGANSEQPGTPPPANSTPASTGNPLQDWVNSIQPAVQWLSNPARVAKFVTGALLLFLGLALLIFPDQSQQAVKSMKTGVKSYVQKA